MATYLDYDVLELEPSRSGPVAEGLTRAHETLDSQTGERWTDPLEDAAVGDAPFLWLCFSRAEALAQRAWLDRRGGMVVPFWAPTWESDLVLAADADEAAETLTIQRIQYAGLLWAGSNGRRHLAIYPRGGAVSYHYVTEAVDPGSGDTETLTITPALPADCPASTTRIAFLRFCRLSESVVSRIWKSGRVCEASLPFIEIPKEAPAP